MLRLNKIMQMRQLEEKFFYSLTIKYLRLDRKLFMIAIRLFQIFLLVQRYTSMQDVGFILDT